MKMLAFRKSCLIRHGIQKLSGMCQNKRYVATIKDNFGTSQFLNFKKCVNEAPFSTLDQQRFSEKYQLEIKQLMETFPIIIQDFTNNPKYSDIPQVVNRFDGVLRYLVPHGKKTRAIALIHCYKMTEDPKNLTSENIKLINILGWCIELVEAFTFVVDDIIDNSETRREKPCWHKMENVGSKAVLDAFVLENHMYQILRKYFSTHQMYATALKLIHELVMKTMLGQVADTIKPDPSKAFHITSFTRERFQTITSYKTTPLALELPYYLARCFANKLHTENSPQTCKIFSKLGEFFQAQDDFLDCYDDGSITLKIGNDIEEGKCTWLIVEALEKANPHQLRLLETHYGKKELESVRIVKELYEELEIPKAYAIYEEKMFKFINDNIDQVSKITCPEIMFKRLDHLYKQYI